MKLNPIQIKFLSVFCQQGLLCVPTEQDKELSLETSKQEKSKTNQTNSNKKHSLKPSFKVQKPFRKPDYIPFCSAPFRVLPKSRQFVWVLQFPVYLWLQSWKKWTIDKSICKNRLEVGILKGFLTSLAFFQAGNTTVATFQYWLCFSTSVFKAHGNQEI